MADPENENAAYAEGFASVAAGALFQCLAIVGALKEQGVLDPMKVASWADFFADNQGRDLKPELRDNIRNHVKGFAEIIRALETLPPGAGRA